MTLATMAVLRALLDDPTAHRYGFDLAKEAGIATGSLYPILARLEQAGWVDSYWEEQQSGREGRPRRRYYVLTESGAVAARQALADALRRTTPRTRRPAEGIA
ncbi:MAG: helix-turn-helix transcriptional regulator [Nocardiopsaceae bacterium]|nr:helix-turn-helix transcriptional regulator [Nocardiopsaceae bacterium]